MKRRFLCGLSAAASLLLVTSATAVTTTKNIDIVVTHTVPGSVVTTHDYYEPTLSSAAPGTKVPYVFGQAFRMGDVPAGAHASVTDSSGNALPYQIDSISPPWPDGSMRHAVYTVMVPATSGNVHGRLELLLQSGTYSPASTPRSIANLTAHNYQIHYQGVQTHPAGNWPGPYTWSTYGGGSGNFTCNINSLISAGQYEIRANGPVRLEAHVYGFMTADSSGVTDTHLYCDDWIDVYSDPTSSAQVMYVEQMPMISQPIADPADGSSPPATTPNNPDPNADFVIGQASLCDGNSTGPGCQGATKLRDFADDNIMLSASNVNPSDSCGTHTFTPPSGTQAPTRAAYKLHLVSGTLPGGLSEGQIGFTGPYVLCQPRFALRNSEWTNAGDDWNITSAGTGSFQLVSQQSIPYYNGFFITQQYGGLSGYSVGVPIMQGGTWTPPSGWFPEPDLDGTTNNTSTTACAGTIQTGCSQKAYWQQSGLIPGWDFSYQNAVAKLTPNTYGMGGDENGFYVAGANGPYRSNIDTGGGDYDTGPWNEWLGKWFERQGATNWDPMEGQMAWIGGLATVSLPNVLMARLPGTGGCPDNTSVPAHKPCFIPWDNGPNDAGANYTGIGSPCPNDVWYADNNNSSNVSCFVFPANATGALPVWAYGPYGGHFTNYHWPPSAYIEYEFFGRDYLLRLLRGSGERGKLQQALNKNNTGNWTGDGKLYYQAILPCSTYGSGGIMNPWASALLGPATDPEIPYFQHFVATNNAFIQAFYNRQNAQYKAAGACVNGGNADGFNTFYATLGLEWAWTASRQHGPDYIVKLRETLASGMFDATGNPPSGVGTWGVRVDAGPIMWYDTLLGGFSGADAPTFRANKNIGIDAAGTGYGMWIATNGVMSYDPNTWQGWISNGDEIIPFVDGGSWQGPPELAPPNFPEDTTFYITNLNTTTHTFNITPNCSAFDAQGSCTSPDSSRSITSISAGPWNGANCPGSGSFGFCYWNVRPKADGGGMNLGAGELFTLRHAEITEAMRGGVTTDGTYSPSPARADAVLSGRAPNASQGFCTGEGATSFARNCMSSAVPVYPPLTGP